MRLLGSIPEEATYRSISSGSEGVFAAHGIGGVLEGGGEQYHHRGSAYVLAPSLSDPEDDGVGFLDEAALAGADCREPPCGHCRRPRRPWPRWCAVVYLAAVLLVTGASAVGGFMLGARGRSRPLTVSTAASVLREIEGAALQLAGRAAHCPGGGACAALAFRGAAGPAHNSSSTTSVAATTASGTSTTTSTRSRTAAAAALTSQRLGPGSENCVAYGCVDYTPSHACQCNARCGHFGNCCPDFRTACASPPDPSVPSCQLYGCAAFDRTLPCQCDALCQRFGNCCRDAAERCHVEEQVLP
mmetsp:Transcript_90818/g.265856  ORF Transcript_90818/g.265856 Transcript_90818/m.265856 type:complete len:301 (-) Transcript_90818:134-1036(-)